MSLNYDPIWPWSKLDGSQTGTGFMGQFLFVFLVALLVLLPLLVVGLSLASYLLGHKSVGRRMVPIVLLRLGACFLVFVAILRPSLGFDDPSDKHGLVLVAIDGSESMSIIDELDNQSRWDYLQRILKDNAPALKKLADEKKIDVVFYRFTGDATEVKVEELGKPDGKRTDFGTMLRTIYEGRSGQQPLLGLLVFSDGADNGTKIPALSEAARWRKHPCPIHTFALGKPTTSDRQQDIAITGITTSPSPQVPLKAELTAKVMVDAHGFEGKKVRVHLLLDDQEVVAQDATLPLTTGNVIEIKCNAPAKPGEVKVTVKIDPLQGEVNPNNNTIDTYVTVTHEGISVLIVDKQRGSFEPQLICDALAEESRIRLYPVWLRRDTAAGGGDSLFGFDRQQYDVIIIGDVTAEQMKAGNPEALNEIEKLVKKGSGLIMLGGYKSFGPTWQGTKIADILPVELNGGGQNESETNMHPAADGAVEFKYFMQLTDKKDDSAAAWDKLYSLKGTTRLGKLKPASKEVAQTTAKAPLLVAGKYGEGRTLAFGGDTTNRWIRNAETKQVHHQFWRRLVIWLAKQDDMEGSVRVIPDTRRLPLHNDLGFRVEMRSKGNLPIEDGTYKVEVFGPNNLHKTVTTVRNGKENRGVFVNTDMPGEYRIEVSGEGKDVNNEVVSDKGSARFMVYDDDLEMSRRAADHEFLKKLSAAGGGEFHLAKDLGPFLQQFQKQPQEKKRSLSQQWPNWRTTKMSPFFIIFFLIFVAVLAGEWLLRRRWGMA